MYDLGGGGSGGRIAIYSDAYTYLGSYESYGGYRIDTYDLITEQGGNHI
jgi:hypothetical protein